jgi:hypothetical protein
MAGTATREVHVRGEAYRVRDIGTGVREVIHVATARRVGFYIGAGSTEHQVHPQGIDRGLLEEIIREANMDQLV